MLSAVVSRAVGALVGGAAMVITAAGCSTPTTVTDEWRDPSYAAGPMKKIVVLGLGVAPASRHTLEDRFVSDLNARSVQATPAYRIFGDALPTSEQARATLAGGAYDGVLVLRLQRVSEKTRYVPGSGFYGAPYGTYWGSPMYSPGYLVTDQIVSFESSLWDLRDEKLVWSANTQTENPSSGKDFAKSLSKKVLPALSDKGIVSKSPD